MRLAHQALAVTCLVFSAWVARGALELRLHTSLGPGPGFFPFWLSVAFGGLAVALFCQATFQASGLASGPQADDLPPEPGGVLRIAVILVALGGMIGLLQPLGFRLASFAFHVFLLAGLGWKGWKVIVLTGLLGSFGVYHVFTRYFQVSLPVGLFGI